MHYGILIVIIFLIIIQFAIIYEQNYITHNLLSGFWEADKSFCEEAGLDVFCLYINKDYDVMGRRACYVLATLNNEFILNEATTARITLPLFSNTDINKPKVFNITFKEIDEECEDIFPKKQKLKFYPVCNKIVLYYDDVVTAVLYKNPINTEIEYIQDDSDED